MSNLKNILLTLILFCSKIYANEGYHFTIEHFYDTNNTQTIQTITHQKFEPTQTLVHFFRKPKPHWFKFTISTDSSTPITLVLYNSKNNHNIFSFYELSLENRLLHSCDMSKFVPYDKREFSSNVPAYKITLLKDKPRVIYVKTQKDVNVISKFYLDTLEDFYKNRNFVNTVYIAHIVATLAIAFYCLTLFFINYSPIYIYYVFFIFFMNIYAFLYSNLYFYFFDGAYVQYLIPTIPMVYLMLIYITQEIMKFDKIKPPYFYYITKTFKVLLLVFSFILYSDVSLGSTLLYLFSLIFLGYIAYLLVYTSQHHKVYFMALFLFLLSITSMPLMLFGIIDYEGINKYLLILGSSVEIMMFSVVLSQRVYRLNAEKERLSRHLLELKEQQNSILNEEVKRQTEKINLLFKELQHRVKNNFQFILTFLWIQESSTKDKKVLKALKETKNRVYTISLLHELLYMNKITDLNIEVYLTKLIESFQNHQTDIHISSDIEPIALNYHNSVALGLILNELLTNSYKYAFDGITSPLITLHLSKKKSLITCIYTDNGRGFDTKILENNRGFGYEFIQEFSDTLLKSKLSITSQNNFKFELTFST